MSIRCRKKSKPILLRIFASRLPRNLGMHQPSAEMVYVLRPMHDPSEAPSGGGAF
jgi:hypothetical protein